jgi:predicted SAM-dependent methyltransferase
MSRLNVGCGQSPTAGWKNYDNSPSVRLAGRPVTTLLLSKLGMIPPRQRDFIASATQSGILWANVTRHIPEPDRSVRVVYSSHMLEHLDRDEAVHFLKEARRVLRPAGVIRIAVPDLRYHVDNYLKQKDADKFVDGLLMTHAVDRTLFARLRHLWTGGRQHKWMYDGESLCKLLSATGFQDPRVMESGTTRIDDPGELNLREREPESVFVEAVNP